MDSGLISKKIKKASLKMHRRITTIDLYEETDQFAASDK